MYDPTTVDEMVSIVKDASAQGKPVRASGVRIGNEFKLDLTDMYNSSWDTCGVSLIGFKGLVLA